ncbi:MAG: DegT/DnrJ/EryC1/StrS family aminotransferase [Candidatus Paceibacterota bacterium]|jgi:perosamine synthetase
MIPVLRPTIDEQTKKELLEVLDSGWWGFGPKTQEFEKEFAKYVGAKYCVGMNSGTSALDLCLKVYNIKGGELITTPMTFVSDAIVGEWNNMDVTFADIDPDTLCLDPKTLVITPETKAIITVDSHGRLADIKGIREKFKGLIIEDAAHAMYTPGAGKDADITIWSFQAVKSLPMWDGGAITTNDEAIYKKLRTLTWLGVEKSTYDRVDKKKYTWDYDITQSQGIKAYMTDVQAVVGLGQLRRLEKTNARRREIESLYNEAFKDMSQIKIPMHSHTVQYYTMKCENRNELSEFLADNGIATSVHFKPLSEMTYWKKAIKRPLPVTDKVWLKLLSLPVHNALTNEQVNFIISKVKEFYAK